MKRRNASLFCVCVYKSCVVSFSQALLIIPSPPLLLIAKVCADAVTRRFSREEREREMMIVILG